MDAIFNNAAFITGFRAFDVCRNKNIVSKIRSINDINYDIDNTNFSNVFYQEDVVNRKTIPYIYGNVDSFINFPNIIKYPRYSICVISKYNGNGNGNNGTILNIVNPNNIISSFGHNNKTAGIVQFNNSSITNDYTAKNNLNNEWVVLVFLMIALKKMKLKALHTSVTMILIIIVIIMLIFKQLSVN